MLIKKITLNDYKRYVGKHEYLFDKINLISGDNGAGKSTLALHSILFAIHGYSENKLDLLRPRGLANPNTWVEVELEHLGNMYVIKRSIPTSISIKVNGVESTLANNELKKAELIKLFGNIDYFRKFRMVDIKSSINILEQGNADLRKTLINFQDSIDMTAVKAGLSAEKSNREQYNKDTAVIYTHFPSMDRYNVLVMQLDELNQQEASLKAELSSNNQDYYDISNKLGRLQGQRNNLSLQKNKLVNPVCNACGQALKIAKQQEMLAKTNEDLIAVNAQIDTVNSSIADQKDIIAFIQSKIAKLSVRKNNITRLMHRLSTRLEQKDYIWTTADVEVVKQAIKEVDGFSTFYVTERLKSLEPLINNLLNKVGFNVHFSVDAKNNLEINIQKNGQDYIYSELSNGERLLVTVAFQLALLMEKNETGLIIADEGFSSLAENNLNLVFDLFINSPFQLISVVHRYSSNNPNVRNITI